MKTDKITKLLLLMIALGLWVNALAPLFRPAPVAAQNEELHDTLKNIAHDVHGLWSGTCINTKICD